MYQGRTLKVINTLPALLAMATLAVGRVASAGATLDFSYPSGFASTGNALFLVADTRLNGSTIELTPPEAHGGGSLWYIAQQNIQTFTTQFTFQFSPVPSSIPATAAMAFVVQNSNSTTNPDYSVGYVACGDANVGGFGSYNSDLGPAQVPIGNAVAIKFDISGSGQYNFPKGGSPNSTGLYVDGGVYSEMFAANDLNPTGINFNLGHVMAGTIVYDGSVMTLVVQDTVTNAQARYVWPLPNLTTITQGNNAWVGFTAGTVGGSVGMNLLTWSFSTGYNTRLATPTFSVSPGSYTSTQSVSISGPPGATIYYTTNGLLPTSSSTKYTGPISVSSSQIIQAVAIQSGFTDSAVAAANYQIAPTNTPIVNFPSGFGGASGLIIPVGHAVFSGSSIQLTDTTVASLQGQAGAAWYAAPVNVQSFSTNFTLQFTNAQANGMTFAIQNQPATLSAPFYTSGKGGSYVSGGPTAIANWGSALGYGYIPSGTGTGTTGGLVDSVAVTFNLTDNGTGLYTNGVLPSGSDTAISGVTLTSGNPISVALSYDGTTLSMTMTDTKTHGSFSKSWTINIPTTVGGNTAYVGFTGGTGGQAANQNVLSWTYSTSGSSGSPSPVPMAPTNLRVQ
jgi:hypothetical protein